MTGQYHVTLSDDAMNDLEELAIRIVDDRGVDVALGYIGRLEAYCQGLCTFPHRGLSCPAIGPGHRVIGFERRVSIHFRIIDDQVTIVRLLYAGRQP